MHKHSVGKAEYFKSFIKCLLDKELQRGLNWQCLEQKREHDQKQNYAFPNFQQPQSEITCEQLYFTSLKFSVVDVQPYTLPHTNHQSKHCFFGMPAMFSP